jgi:phosphinothricin acetyltransferase
MVQTQPRRPARPQDAAPAPSRAFEIRPVMAADLPGIAAIQAEGVRAAAAAAGDAILDLRQVTALRESLTAGGFPCLVALRDGTVLGFAFARALGGHAAWRAAVEPVVAVRRDAARQGIGRALLAALIEACAARGFRQMIALIAADAAGRALVALHQALGFTQAGLLRGMAPGRNAAGDALLMQRPLGAAPG